MMKKTGSIDVNGREIPVFDDVPSFNLSGAEIVTHGSSHSKAFDPVHKPKHYNEHPSGVECIQITEHMNFCLGNAMKYLWRADLKGGVQDLKKAMWYLEREIKNREAKK